MSHRQFVYERALTVSGLTADNVFASGSKELQSSPKERPFVVIEMGTETPSLNGTVSRQTVNLFVHDDPGSRVASDALLTSLRSVMTADPSASDASVCGTDWAGDGRDTTDEFYKTIYKQATFVVAGRAS